VGVRGVFPFYACMSKPLITSCSPSKTQLLISLGSSGTLYLSHLLQQRPGAWAACSDHHRPGAGAGAAAWCMCMHLVGGAACSLVVVCVGAFWRPVCRVCVCCISAGTRYCKQTAVRTHPRQHGCCVAVGAGPFCLLTALFVSVCQGCQGVMLCTCARTDPKKSFFTLLLLDLGHGMKGAAECCCNNGLCSPGVVHCLG
jgi:hypothetical protein